jgi:hypothetical protein
VARLDPGYTQKEADLCDAFNAKNSPENPKREQHQSKLAELSACCEAVVALVDEYFQPPNLMAWRGDRWEVFVRRRGSATQFGPAEWQPEATQ